MPFLTAAAAPKGSNLSLHIHVEQQRDESAGDDDDFSRPKFAAASPPLSPHESVDDDDISQHEYNAPQEGGGSTTAAVANNNKGYRRVEDWHADHIAANPEGAQVLAHLQREKARWAKTFESLGGEGI